MGCAVGELGTRALHPSGQSPWVEDQFRTDSCFPSDLAHVQLVTICQTPLASHKRWPLTMPNKHFPLLLHPPVLPYTSKPVVSSLESSLHHPPRVLEPSFPLFPRPSCLDVPPPRWTPPWKQWLLGGRPGKRIQGSGNPSMRLPAPPPPVSQLLPQASSRAPQGLARVQEASC